MHSNVTTGGNDSMAEDGNYKSFEPKNTFLHVGCMGGTPLHAYDKAANQDMYDFIIYV